MSSEKPSNGESIVTVTAGTDSPRNVKKSRPKRHKEAAKPWELVEGLRSGERCSVKPTRMAEILWMRRRWPVRGWHRRYVTLDDGILRFSKSLGEFEKGRIRGSADLGFSVISYRASDFQLDIDNDEFVYHFKAKDKSEFDKWLAQLKQHRLFRQDVIENGVMKLPLMNSTGNADLTMTDDIDTSAVTDGLNSTEISPDERVNTWINSAADQRDAHKDIAAAHKLMYELSNLLDTLEGIALDISDLQNNPEAARRLLTSESGLREQFLKSAREMFSNVRLAFSVLADENVKKFTEDASFYRFQRHYPSVHGVPTAQSFFSDLTEYYDAKERLPSVASVITEEGNGSSEEYDEEESDTGSLPETGDEEDVVIATAATTTKRGKKSKEKSSSEKTSSSPVVQPLTWARRECLPVRAPTEGFSFFQHLRKNIGKDLSRVSMPAISHEPLSALQVLCEELEYSELIDKAAETDDPYDRMVLIATFAISRYAATYFRAERKPFNPVLGESFECVREDKNFKFIAEQVSHHPPVSAAHCEGKGWQWDQEARVKITFWGKSMEIQPLGFVQLKLEKHKETYCWNKVTSMIHNIIAGTRWIDQYGEMNISCDSGVKAKIIFEKAGWMGRRYDIQGSVYRKDSEEIVHRMFGKWTEAIYLGSSDTARCIWRPGAMPPDHQLYYGFTRFAIELNELTTDMQLPPTDTRYRPDQRLLEEGKVADADDKKQEVENKQRQLRKHRESASHHFEPMWFEDTGATDENGDKIWRFKGNYWNARLDGFRNLRFQEIW